MHRLTWVLAFSTLAGIGSAALAGLLFLVSPRHRQQAVPWLVAFAAGTLLGAALLDLLPEALRAGEARTISTTLLGSILGFFALERWIVGQHCHDQDCARHAAIGPVVLLGDAFHNFVDGVAIAAAFGTSVSVGIATSLAVLAHEIPQEIGNVALLLQAGYPPKRAFAYNVAANSVAVLGALVGALVLGAARAAIPYVLSVACASFLYIAIADLIPDLHRAEARAGNLRAVALLSGVLLVGLLHVVTD